MTGNDYTLVLRVGEHLSRQAVSCPTGEYVVVHQHDGNVVLYRNADAAPIWATNTVFQDHVCVSPERVVDPDRAYGRPGRLLLREDGDLVVLSEIGERLWASGTADRGVASLMIHDWGKLVLKNDQGHILWQTDRAPRRWDGWNHVCDGRRLRPGQTLRGQTLTSDNGHYQFVTTFDGGAQYLCRTDGPVLWAKFGSSPRDGLEMTEDGRLVSRSPDGIVRPGNGIDVPHDLPAAEFLVGDDGRLMLRDNDGATLWAGPAPKPTPATGPDRSRSESESDERLNTESTPVIRVDFADDEVWQQITEEITADYDYHGDGLLSSAAVSLIDDHDFAGLTPERLVQLVPDDVYHPIAFIVDAVTVADPDHPVLVVDLDDELDDGSVRSFRVLPRTGALASLENNVSLLGNMDFDDFARRVDEAGVFR